MNSGSIDSHDLTFWRRDPAFRSAGGISGSHRQLEGDRYLYDVIRTIYANATHFLTTTSWADRFTRTALFFVNNQTLTAIAAQRGQRRAVAVYTGAAQWLWSAFRCALTDEHFAACFLEGAPPVPPKTIDIKEGPTPDWYEVPSDWPEERLAFLRELYTRAVDFLIFHELAHHARGHIELIQRALGLDVIDEGRNAAAINQQENRLLRFIEFDADIHALDMRWLDCTARRPLEGRDEERIGSDLVIDIIAMTTLFMMLDIKHSAIESQYETPCPPPAHRAIRATHALASAYGRECGWEWDRVTDLHDEGWLEASWLAVILGLPPGRWQGEITEDMHTGRLEEEEQGLLEFSRALDAENESLR